MLLCIVFYKVKLVDYGDIISVALKDIRPLRSDHVAALIGTGIRCTLCLGPSYNPLVTLNSDGTTRTDYFNEDEGWTLEDRSMLLDFIYNKDVLVDFQQRTVLSSVSSCRFTYVYANYKLRNY